MGMERAYRVGAEHEGWAIGIEDISFFLVFYGRQGAFHLIVQSGNSRVFDSHFYIVNGKKVLLK